MAAKRGPKSPMTDEHKAALALGRVEGRAVREYLESLLASARDSTSRSGVVSV